MQSPCDYNNHVMCIEPCNCECHDEQAELAIDETVRAWAGWLDNNLPILVQ